MEQTRKRWWWKPVSSEKAASARPLFLAAALLIAVVSMTGCTPSTAVTLTDLVHAHIYKGIVVGEVVHFSNTTSKDTTLCLGSDGKCAANAQGPQELQPPGLKIAASQSRDVVFSQKGTFQIASTSDSEVVITINVA